MKIEEVLTGLPVVEELIIIVDGDCYETLTEGKWIIGRFKNNIRIDRPTHGAGQVHAHILVLGRRGNELGVINLDGTASHGTKMVLSQEDATALQARDFVIPPNRVIEWFMIIADRRQVLFG
jgi:hypothetical protein